jgi:hypothetical protein
MLMNYCNAVVLVLISSFIFNADNDVYCSGIPHEWSLDHHAEQSLVDNDLEDDVITRSGCKRIRKALCAQGNAHFCNNIDVRQNLEVEGTVSACGFSNICPFIGLTGATGPTGSLNLSGPLVLNGPVIIGSCSGTTGDLTVGGTVEVCSDSTVQGELSVTGAGFFPNEIIVNGEAFLNGDTIINGELFGGTGVFTGDVAIGGSLNVEGNFNACGRDLCCATTRYAFYRGTVTSQTSGPVTVTFPANYFSATPVIILTIAEQEHSCDSAWVPASSSTSFEVSTNSVVGISCDLTSTVVNYIAVGTPGSGYCPEVSD